MIVYAECSFFIPMAASLKDKRSILRSMTKRVKNSYNVSIAEVDHQNVWQRTTLAIVSVASAKAPAEKEIERTIRLLESNPDWEMTESNIDYY